MPAESDRLEVYEAADGWRWRRLAANNQIGCTGEAHTRKADAERASLRWNPDLDPSWTPVGVVLDTRPLDLLDKLLAPGHDDDLDAVRAELGGKLP